MMWITRQRSRHGSLAAVKAGEGSSVTLLHGVGLCADAWGGQFGALSGHFSLKAFDMPGHGCSPQPDLKEPALADYANVVGKNLTEPTALIGHSMGAMIAMQLAMHPLVTGFVALNAIYQRTLSAKDAVRKRASEMTDSERPDPKPTITRWFGDEVTPEAEACRGWLNTVSPQGYKKAYTVFANDDGPSAQDLAKLNKPALFMTGALDPNSTPVMSTQMAAACSKGQAVIIDAAAHMMPMTHCDLVNEHLISFIKGCFNAANN